MHFLNGSDAMTAGPAPMGQAVRFQTMITKREKEMLEIIAREGPICLDDVADLLDVWVGDIAGEWANLGSLRLMDWVPDDGDLLSSLRVMYRITDAGRAALEGFKQDTPILI